MGQGACETETVPLSLLRKMNLSMALRQLRSRHTYASFWIVPLASMAFCSLPSGVCPTAIPSTRPGQPCPPVQRRIRAVDEPERAGMVVRWFVR